MTGPGQPAAADTKSGTWECVTPSVLRCAVRAHPLIVKSIWVTLRIPHGSTWNKSDAEARKESALGWRFGFDLILKFIDELQDRILGSAVCVCGHLAIHTGILHKYAHEYVEIDIHSSEWTNVRMIKLHGKTPVCLLCGPRKEARAGQLGARASRQLRLALRTPFKSAPAV